MLSIIVLINTNVVVLTLLTCFTTKNLKAQKNEKIKQQQIIIP